MSTDNIKYLAKELKLGGIKNTIDDFLLEAIANNYSVQDAIELLLDSEFKIRRTNGISRRIRYARFPYKMHFEMFRSSHLSPDVVQEIKTLETLSFVQEKSNVILIGNPGVGKTALSIAIGSKLCEEGGNVGFFNIPNLVIEMKEAMSLNQLSNYKKKFEKLDLVILDDLGYCSFDRECGEVLFNLLTCRNEKGSMIITTNLTFDRWSEIFVDPVLTGAIVDRVAHRAHIVDMTGDSYRVLDTKSWASDRKQSS